MLLYWPENEEGSQRRAREAEGPWLVRRGAALLPRPPLGSKVSGTPEAALSGQNGTQGSPRRRPQKGTLYRPVWQENGGKCRRSISSTENLVFG